MTHPKPFQKSYLLIGILYKHTLHNHPILEDITSQFGPIQAINELGKFSSTSYYNNEMKPSDSYLQKAFIEMELLVESHSGAEIKLKTNEIEDKYTLDGNRQFNLDPGFLTPYSFILFTAKNYAHRIPLQNGIYAELTYTYTKKSYTPLPWAYPDYTEKRYIDYFNALRSRNLDTKRENISTNHHEKLI